MEIEGVAAGRAMHDFGDDSGAVVEAEAFFRRCSGGGRYDTLVEVTGKVAGRVGVQVAPGHARFVGGVVELGATQRACAGVDLRGQAERRVEDLLGAAGHVGTYSRREVAVRVWRVRVATDLRRNVRRRTRVGIGDSIILRQVAVAVVAVQMRSARKALPKIGERVQASGLVVRVFSSELRCDAIVNLPVAEARVFELLNWIAGERRVDGVEQIAVGVVGGRRSRTIAERFALGQKALEHRVELPD